MKRDRNELENYLIEVIKDIRHDRKAVERINQTFREQGLAAGTFNMVTRSANDIYSLDVAKLFVLSLALYNETKNNNISPHEYFSDIEITNAKRHIENETHNQTLELPIELLNVIKMSEEEYMTRIDIKVLVNMYHSQLIYYDFETQRSAKFKKHLGDKFIEVPNINKFSVNDIASHMLNGTYLPDTITLNIFSNEFEAITFNNKNNSLMINKGAEISILDGFHRLQGAVKAVNMNPDINLQLFLSVRSYDKDIARSFFGQINTVTIVKKERLKELKSDKPSDTVVRNLMRSPNSDLKGRIASAPKINELAKQLTTFDILSFAIDSVFKPKTQMDIRETSEYLEKFFNYLIGYYPEEFLLNPSVYKNTYINHPLMFVGYIKLAKKLQDDNHSMKDLRQVIENINFEDSKLIELLRHPGGVNSNKIRNQLLQYFQ